MYAGLGQADGADVVTWDATMTTNPAASNAHNRGCPVGYFAQAVAPGEPGAVPSPRPEQYWLRCRRLATSTAETIREESDLSVREVAAVVTEAVKDTARQVGQTVATALTWTPWVAGAGLVGLLALAWLSRPRLGGR